MLGEVWRKSASANKVLCLDGKLAAYHNCELAIGTRISFDFSKIDNCRVVDKNSVKEIYRFNSEQANTIFSDILYNWKLDSAEEKEDLFYVTNDFNNIYNGNKCFVIGRKGTGKTAIAQNLNAKVSVDSKNFISNLDFSDFQFEKIEKYKVEGFPTQLQFVLFWKHCIFLHISRLILDNEFVQKQKKKNLMNYLKMIIF
jgi:Cdc6-like AAA superfamily ATPase